MDSQKPVKPRTWYPGMAASKEAMASSSQDEPVIGIKTFSFRIRQFESAGQLVGQTYATQIFEWI